MSHNRNLFSKLGKAVATAAKVAESTRSDKVRTHTHLWTPYGHHTHFLPLTNHAHTYLTKSIYMTTIHIYIYVYIFFNTHSGVPSVFWELATLVPSKNFGHAFSVNTNNEYLI
jgi:hypothetical protein